MKDEAVIAFNLKDGRRKEPIAEQQVANVVDAQLAVNRQILAQQLTGAIDPQTLSSLAQSRSGNGTGVLGLPIIGGGAVGYQPIIIWLSSGAMLAGPNGGVTAVVSADRRYVRISASPVFSGIAKVDTFNMATGQTGTQSQTPGGNTGGGYNPTQGSSQGAGSGIGSGGGIF